MDGSPSSVKRLGSTEPRLYTRPLVTGPAGPCGCGCALTPETSYGFAAADFARDMLGFTLMPWQRWLLIHAMETVRRGRTRRFRFRTVLILVARQNGKTTLVEVKNLFKMFVLRVGLVIGTAQNLDVSEESWDSAVELVEANEELAAEIPPERGVVRVNGKKTLCIEHVDGNGRVHRSRWKVAAASRRGGRGFKGADDINLDELREHQNWDSWAAVTKTGMARANAQIWAFSNAGDDRSVVLNSLQEKGYKAIEDPAADLGHFEWSAPEDCALDDRDAWAYANPSLGYPQGISEEALQSALNTDPEPVFRTENLCQRVPDLQPSKIPLAPWLKCADPRSQIIGLPVIAWEVSWKRDFGAIGLAGFQMMKLPQLELVEYRPGTDWIAARIADIVRRHGAIAIVFNPGGPGGSLLTDVQERLRATLGPIKAKKIDPKGFTPRMVADGCGGLYDAVTTVFPGEERGQMRHLGDDRLLKMLRESATRELVDKWAWDLKGAVGDICGLSAVTYAYQGLVLYGKPKPPPAPPQVETASSGAQYRADDVMTMSF